MQTLDNKDWLYTIEDLVDEACQGASLQQVKDVFSRYGAEGLDDLNSSNYDVVYADLKNLVYNS